MATIVGLGATPLSREDRNAEDLAVQAVRLAAADAGMSLSQIDGLLLSSSPAADPLDRLDLDLQQRLGLLDLRLLAHVDAKGASACAMVQYAALSVQAGMATVVACVFSDAPVRSGSGGRQFSRPVGMGEPRGLTWLYGMYGAVNAYALAASRYASVYGLPEEALADVAIAQRAWAGANPHAVLREPFSRADYFQSQYVSTPLRILDCAYPVNGATAILVTDSARAEDLPSIPIQVLGVGESHPGNSRYAGLEREIHPGGGAAGRQALSQAGLHQGDLMAAEFYAPFSFVTILCLEDYGFCERGEGPAFVMSGAIAPGGALPCHTGGGQLSGGYLQGMTPLAEGIRRLRDLDERHQSAGGAVLVTGMGGFLDHHAALILARE